MSENTKIEWCDHSWSPWRGGTNGKPLVLAKNWEEPLKWDKRARISHVAAAHETPAGKPIRFHRPTVFPSLCDWIDDEVTVEWLARFLKLIHETQNLTWLLLTKRPENWEKRMALASEFLPAAGNIASDWLERRTIPGNVWIGTSVENQEWADKRIPALLNIPSVGRFLSLEPLLGPVEVDDIVVRDGSPGEWHINALDMEGGSPEDDGEFRGATINWMIIGGESGPGARPCNVEWIRALVAQGKAAGVATFVKQLGAVVHSPNDQGWECISGEEPTPRSWPTNDPDAVEHNPNGFKEEYQGAPVRVLLNHPKGGDPAEWPEDLRVRQYPEGLR